MRAVAGATPREIDGGARRPRRAAPRADIQGLRAVAVLLVVLGHAGMPMLAGGYVGVDVFFVISGFLITGWLLRRATERRSVPFGEFYGARARRILPAATLTLVATAVACTYLLNYVRAAAALRDEVWAAVFAANVHFSQVNANYFAADDPPSPIQHFWTLAVEEQFYLLWPLLLAGLMLLSGRRSAGRGPPRTRGLTVLVAAGVVASLAWSIHVTSSDPQAAYFSATARAWELGIGALVAVALADIARIPVWIRALATWAGLAGILLAATAYDGGTAFPGYAALLPVLSAALVIAGGVPAAPRRGVRVVLDRGPMRLVGDLSYSLYLWHWPVLVIALGYVGHDLPLAANLALIGGAFLLSLATYSLFENPLRHGRLLRPTRSALVLWPSTIAAVVLVTALASGSLTQQQAAAARLGAADNAANGLEQADLPTAFYRASVAESVTAKRMAAPVPNALAPPLQRLPADVVDIKGCFADGSSRPICRWGDAQAQRIAVVLGDSHARMWLPGVERFGRDRQWQVVPLIKLGCVPALIYENAACTEWFNWALDTIRDLHPGVIIVSQFWSSWGTLGSNPLQRELADVSALAPTTVLVEDPPPKAQTPVDCLLSRDATLGSCVFPIDGEERATYDTVHAFARTSGVRYLPTVQWICSGGLCPTVIGNVVAYRDTDHLSATYSRLLAGPFARLLAARTEPPAAA
ncbi:MAG: acyltransferase family protein [Gaiellales bacterium]